MQHSIVLAGKQFPTIGQYLIKTRIYSRSLQANSVTWQYGRWCIQRSNLRCATLQLQVDIHDMEFVHQTDTLAFVIGFIVGVLIDNTDDLLRRYILSVRLTGNIERGGLRRFRTLDREELLIVGHIVGIIEYIIRDDRTLLSGSTPFR